MLRNRLNVILFVIIGSNSYSNFTIGGWLVFTRQRKKNATSYNEKRPELTNFYTALCCYLPNRRVSVYDSSPNGKKNPR